MRSSAFSSISYYLVTLGETLYLPPVFSYKQLGTCTLFPLTSQGCYEAPIRMHVKNLTVLGSSSGRRTPSNLGLLSCFLFLTCTNLPLPQGVLHELFPLPLTLGGGCFLCALIILKKPVVIFLIEGLFNQVLERLALFVTQGSAQTSSLQICLLHITYHSLKLSWVVFFLICLLVPYKSFMKVRLWSD